jgi:hypothetical protein
MRKLELGSWDYDDYLTITGRDDNSKTKARWLEVIALINSKHYDGINNEVRETIDYVDMEVLKENL